MPLFFFKYFSLINSALFRLLDNYHIHWPLPEINLLLPVGISFYTFMAIGYSVDVYNEVVETEKNVGRLGLFLSFFPLVLSGPIERAGNMLQQFKQLKGIDTENLIAGLKMIIWGYFMKLVVADRISIYSQAILGNIFHHNGSTLLLVSFFHPMQMYADFGGYSLIAVGTAKVLGINVMQNFNRPFFSVSIAEFWRRWHISLISWLTDYIYIPLSFYLRKYKQYGIIFAIMVTFFISGIWHGATINFIVWGLLQGIFLSTEALLHKSRNTFEKRYNLNKNSIYITFSILTTIVLITSSNIFGGASSIKESLFIFSEIFTNPGPIYIGQPTTFLLSILSIIFLLSKDFIDEFYPKHLKFFGNRYLTVRVFSYSTVILLILLFGVFDGGQFIYFQY